MAGNATARRPRTSAPKPRAKTKIAPADFLAITSWLDTEVLVERGPELRILTLGLLAGVNVHQIGPPGVAKSLGLRQYTKCVTGANYFEKTMHAQTPADAIVGGYDMDLFAKGGGLVRKTEGYMPWAHIAFIDEFPRANGPTMDATLPMMNSEERLAEHNGGMAVTNLLFVVTASNTWFDPDNTQAQALSDRVTLMQMVRDLKSDESFKEVIRRHHGRNLARFAHTGADGTLTKRPTVSLAQVQQAQAEAAAVQPSAEFLDAFAKVRREAAAKGLHPSPRRLVEAGRVCRASAWLAGRTEIIPDDLIVLEHVLWREERDLPIAAGLVQDYHGRFVREAREKRSEAAKPLSMVEQIRPQVEGTPPNQELDPAVIKEAINASRAIDEVSERVTRVLDEAEREKRDASDLRDLANELLAVQKWFHANNLPTRYKPNGN